MKKKHSGSKRITTETLERQIKAYEREYPRYATFADALKRVLEQACDACIPERIVQARPKSVSSFAEKCVRKYPKYKSPVRQFTDLCGVRVIVQTPEQVRAVKLFIEQNFKVVEQEDKGLLLETDEFGYRDMHYLVKLLKERAPRIGFTRRECNQIGQRIAEVQVRSIVQHAWADILHDRMYKTPLKLSAEANRTGALLAAIMEDGDRTFDRLAIELDGMAANYSAYAGRSKVGEEIAALELILKSENERKAQVALRLARCLGPCGEYRRIVGILTPLLGGSTELRWDVCLELGHALCRVHRGDPGSPNYQKGQRLLEEVVDHCRSNDVLAVPNLRRRRSLHAKALSRLAWSWEATDADSAGKALERYRQALELEPSNPYHLSNQLGFEIFCHHANALSVVESMRTTLRRAITTCREHALAGTELPYALFTAGRLSLLLRESGNALGWYARGLRHLFDGSTCVPEDVLEDELCWIDRLHFGAPAAPDEHRWIKRLIALGRRFYSRQNGRQARSSGKAGDAKRILIVAGGAGTMTGAMLKRIRPALAKAFEHFNGTVVSGGTRSGIPGCVGELTEELRRKKRKHFKLVGYCPEFLPDDAPKDSRYDRHEIIPGERGFSPEQVLRMWEDLCNEGVSPASVSLLGFGGGPVSAVEYRVAFALGASVGIVQDSGGEADLILADPIWAGEPALMALPFDQASVQAFATAPRCPFSDETVEMMAQEFHARYVKGRAGTLPENVRPWPKLPRTYQTANIEQARYALEILDIAGFGVQRSRRGARDAIRFTARDIERMAELEHGRWNIERLRDGWRPGEIRNDEEKIHNCLVPWKTLPASIKKYDRNSVMAFPEILAQAGLKVVRRKS